MLMLKKKFDLNTRAILPSMVLGAGLALATFTGAATAATAEGDIPAVNVKYGDLDISTKYGLHILYGRIVAAANSVCPQWGSHDLDSLAAAQSCREAAIARAVHQIGNPQLAALSASRQSRG